MATSANRLKHRRVANINLDYFSNWGWGRTRDFSIVGLGNSTLDDLTAAAVQRQGRVLTGDTAPEMGFYFRSDHYEFARVGVPSLETAPGIDYVGKPAGFGGTKRADYIANDYHNASDVIKADWDLFGPWKTSRFCSKSATASPNNPTAPHGSRTRFGARGLHGNFCRHESPPAGNICPS
jgi:Zn-dependent M28 family amino/carboxypeptidase